MQKIISLFTAIFMFIGSSFSALFGIETNYKYCVGAKEEYKTINQALKQWAKDGNPKATVYISNGEYHEKIFVDSGNTISFIGESRDGVVIITKTGNYTDAPIFIRHGNIEIKNMTVIANHSENPKFSYTDGTSSTKAYAIHIDGGQVGGKVLIKNVTAISYQSPALGLGLIPNSTIRIENSECISYTDKKHNGSAVGFPLTSGALLCHRSSPKLYPDRGSEKLELVNVKMYSENTENTLYLLNHVPDETFNLLAVNTVLDSGYTENGEGTFVYSTKAVGGSLALDSLSRNNTCKDLNYKLFKKY